MDSIEKALKKLTLKQRGELSDLLVQIQAGQLENLDVKKLIGKKHIYRVRKGDLRIIFERLKDKIQILALEHRSTTTYKKR